MGFFTKIKKLWGAETDEVQASARAATAQDTPQTGLEQPPDAATHAPQLDPLWKAGLESSLRGSRARISEWLGQLLSGLEAADEALWARLRSSLHPGAPLRRKPKPLSPNSKLGWRPWA
jgi:fused signal recognition particle receptor